MRLTLKPGDEFFLSPDGRKEKAYAHIGIVGDRLVVVNDPYRAYCVSYLAPFKYGMSVSTVPIIEDHIGTEVQRQCYGLEREALLAVVNVDSRLNSVTVDIMDTVTVHPRAANDEPIADGLEVG